MRIRIPRGLCVMALGALAACTTTTETETGPQRSQVAYTAASAAHAINAIRAVVLAGHYLQVRYTDGDSAFIVTAVLPDADSGPEATSGPPPIAPFEPVETVPASAGEHGVPVAIRSTDEWGRLMRQLERELAELAKGKGIVLDVLQEDDVFLYLDASGKLHAVPLTEKPATVAPTDTVKLTELLEQAAERIAGSLQHEGDRERYLLFNTGDAPDTGYPFVLLDLEKRRVFFIQRSGQDHHLLAYGPARSAQAVFHALNSQARSLATRPLSTFTRLILSLGTTAWDTLQPTPTWYDPATPPPPVGNAEFMDTAAWERELDETVGGSTWGRIRYLVDGDAFFPTLIHELKAARETIRMRMYIFDNDDYAITIADLLKRRSSEVSVEILLDGFGTITGGIARPDYTPGHQAPAPLSIASYLRGDSDISVRMLPNPWMQGDHSKTILIDDDTAFLGGMNIGREYRYEWHDLMIEATGPVVDVLIRDFEDAQAQSGPLGDLQATLQRSRHPIRAARSDDYPLRLIYTRIGSSQILRSQLAAMRRARNRIWIQNAYLTSDRVIHELVKARRRGVDVRVIMPYQTDSGLISRSNVLAANLMLRNHIRVYIYPGMSHLKAAIYDGWACMGSANFDRLSLRLNRETNIATSYPAAVDALATQVFLTDFGYAVELTEPLPAAWLDYLKEQIADHL